MSMPAASGLVSSTQDPGFSGEDGTILTLEMVAPFGPLTMAGAHLALPTSGRLRCLLSSRILEIISESD